MSGRLSQLIGLALLCFTVLPGPSANAAEVRVGFDAPRPPYILITEDGGLTGIEVEVVRAALKEVGLHLRATSTPLNRRIVELRQDRLDAVASGVVELPGVYYSDDYVNYHNFAITHAADRIPIYQISDLTGHSIVAWEGARGHLGAEFSALAATQGDYYEVVDQKAQVRMFLARRAEVAIADINIFKFFARTAGADVSDFRFAPVFGPKTSYQVSFRSEELRDQFNEGLRRLRVTGQFMTIHDPRRY